MEIAVIYLYGVEPVVNSRFRSICISGGLCREFVIFSLHRQPESLAGIIEEVILCRPMHAAVVTRSQNRMPVRIEAVGGQRPRGKVAIITRDMIWNEVNDELEPRLVRSFHQILEFLHSFPGIVCEIWIDVEIVGDCIWRPCLPFDP